MKKKVKSKKLLSLIFAIPAATVFPLSSCGLNQPWDFETATKKGTEINYCLLIGQNDHTDSIERTRSTRRALATLDESDETKAKTKDNPNIAKPIKGKVRVTNPKTSQYVYLPVNEIEQMEQKSMAGTPWDPITANGTTATWIAKHGHNITFFVSNNDGMAEGAMWAANWIKGMPIFGYDANASTLQWINSGHITGTVDQNASTQCGAGMMVIRNMLEDRDAYWANNFDSEQAHGFGSKDYDPMNWRGFKWSNSNEGELDQYGYVDGKLITEHSLLDNPKHQRLILSASTAIAKLGREDSSYNNIKNYMNADGTPKEPKDLFDTFTHISKDAHPEKQYTVCQTYCNRAEAFLMGTLKPYFDEYAKRLNISLDQITGDGNGEETILNEMRNRPNKYDAFLINMSKTTSTLQYVIDIAKKAYDYESNVCGMKSKKVAKFGPWEWSNDPNWTGWDEWDLRLDTPLIFFNRQPHKDSGEFDTEIMHNKFFKYTYCIAADPVQGGETQGNLIQHAIETWYEDWINKQD